MLNEDREREEEIDRGTTRAVSVGPLPNTLPGEGLAFTGHKFHNSVLVLGRRAASVEQSVGQGTTESRMCFIAPL